MSSEVVDSLEEGHKTNYQTGLTALSIRPNLKYTREMENTTLTLTLYEQERLVDALNAEVTKWMLIKGEILLGKRPNGSLEGCDMILADAESLHARVKVQVSQLG